MVLEETLECALDCKEFQSIQPKGHHRLNGHELEKDLGVGDGQGSLACCGSWGHKELDMT